MSEEIAIAPVDPLRSVNHPQLLIETIPHGIAEIDLSGRIVFSNAAHDRLMGYAPGELIGKAVWELHPPEVRSELQQYFQQVLSEQPTPSPYVGQLLTHDNRSIGVQIDWNYKRLPATDGSKPGELQGFALVVMDISQQQMALRERQRAENALRELKAHLEELVEQRTTALKQANEKLILEILERRRVEAERLYRVELEQLISTLSTNFINLTALGIDSAITEALQQIRAFVGVDRSSLYLFTPANRKILEKTHECCVPTILPRIHRRPKIRLDRFPWLIQQLRDRGLINISQVVQLPEEAVAERTALQEASIQSVLAVPLIVGGQTIGLLGFETVRIPKTWTDNHIRLLRIVGEIIANALDRQNSISAVKESEKRLRSVVQTAGSVIICLSTDFQILEWNREAERVFGWSHAEVLGKNYFQLCLSEKVKEQALADFTQAALGTPLRNAEYPICTLGNQERFLLWNVTALQDDEGHCLEIIACGQDITERKIAENTLQTTATALSQSEARFKAIANNVPGMIYQFVLATDGSFALPFVSPGCRDIYGVEPEEFQRNVQQLVIETIHPDYRTSWEQSVAESARTLQDWKWQGQIITRKGEMKWLAAVAHPEKQANGDVLWDGFLTDITQQRASEVEKMRLIASLIESEQRLQLALEGSSQGLWDWNVASDEFYCSPHWTEILGYNVEDIPHSLEGIRALLHPQDKLPMLKELSRHLNDRTPFFETECRLQAKSGEWKWICARGKVFNRDRLGVPRRAIGTVKDITDRKHYEDRLEKERQQLRQIVACAPAAMAVFDTEMCYLAHSQKWLEIHGISHPDCQTDNSPSCSRLIGCSLYTLLPDIPDRWRDSYQRGLQGEVIYTPEDIWERADGTTLYLRWAVHPWYSADGQVGGIAIATDTINELVEAREAALEAAKLKSQFLANMSHEIRTPMNGMFGMSDLLLRTQLTPQQRDYIQTIRSSAEHLLAVLNDILDFSKLEAGVMELENLDFNLEDCLDAIADVMAAPAAAKGLQLAMLVDSSVPRQLRGDPARLRQILLNLVNNAIKFTPEGEALVSCDRVSADERSLTLRFAVRDTGIGIDPRDRHKLFDPFSQADASTTRKYGGTGLGLTICKQLVEQMGGEIGVESQLGMGSTFWFTAQFEYNSIPQPQLPKDLKLLVADPHPATRQAIKLFVEAWGIPTIDEAAKTADVLLALHAKKYHDYFYDAVILNVQLLGPSIFKVIQEFCQKTGSNQTHFILITPLDRHTTTEDALPHGACNYLLKPIRASRLYATLSGIATSRHLEKEGNEPEPDLTDHLISSMSVESESEPNLTIRKSFEELSPKILVVEDHLINQRVILKLLEALGYQADCVDNGLKALNRITERDYDIILMDCQMPVMDGYEATKQLRLQNNDVTIIALTAHALPENREQCLAAGMNDYLSKPVKIEELALILERWIPQGDRVSRPQEEGTVPPSLSTPDNLGIDVNRLQQISRGSLSFQRQILETFVEVATSDLDAIAQSIRENHSAAVQRQAHRLKGSSSNVGATAMSSIASTLEEFASENNLKPAPALLRALTQQLRHLEVFIEQNLQG